MGALKELLARRVERITGFSLTDDLLTRRLLALVGERARATGAGSAAAYLERLEREPDADEEWPHLVAGLVNGQTSFFRDAKQLAAITDLVSQLSATGPVSIWSAGCATGEEPYSLAILCAERGLSPHILATDLSPAFLARAEEGCYAAWALRNVAPDRRARWFDALPRGRFRARARLREMVELRRHNLVVDPPPRPSQGRWQLILCRNVFLYFHRDSIAFTCRKLAEVLAPNGRLAVAASEHLRGIDAPLVAESMAGRVFYRVSHAAHVGGSRASAAPASRLRPRETAPRAPEPQLAAVVLMAEGGRVGEAIDLLGRVSPAPVDLPLFHLTRGHLHLRLHDLDAALAAYRDASEADPLLCETYYFTGIAWRKAGDWNAAAVALRQALFLAPSFWQAAYFLAGAYDRLGRTDDAARERTRARRLLRDQNPGVAFLSHPLFLAWFSVRAEEASRST